MFSSQMRRRTLTLSVLPVFLKVLRSESTSIGESLSGLELSQAIETNESTGVEAPSTSPLTVDCIFPFFTCTR